MLDSLFTSLIDKIGPWVFINVRGIEWLEPYFVLCGIHDIVLICLGLFIYKISIKTKSEGLRGGLIILTFTLFLYVFPLFASRFEAMRVHFLKDVNGDMIDGFNLWYCFFRFPMYWGIGVLILLIDRFGLEKFKKF